MCTCGGGLPDPRELVVEDSLSLRAPPSGATECFLTVGEGREGGGVGEEETPWVETRVGGDGEESENTSFYRHVCHSEGTQ